LDLTAAAVLTVLMVLLAAGNTVSALGEKDAC
jgi:hypothetical protein